MLLSKKEREGIIKKINHSVSGWLAVVLLFAIAVLFFFLKLLFIAIAITIILYLVYFIVWIIDPSTIDIVIQAIGNLLN